MYGKRKIWYCNNWNITLSLSLIHISLEYANQKGLVELVKKVKEKFPNKTIWCYTGFDFEKDVMGKMYKNWEETRELVDNIDAVSYTHLFVRIGYWI